VISVENLKFFPSPCILRPRWIWVPELGGGVKKTLAMGLQGRRRSLMISSAVFTQSTNVTDIQTDGRTDTGRRQGPRLRIASRGKNRYRKI